MSFWSFGIAFILEDAAEDVPELEIVVCALLLHLLEGGEDLGRDGLLDLADHGVVLEHLARDVEGQVGGVHHALREAEVFGEEHLEVVADEDVAHVEREAVLRLGHVDVHAGLLGQEEERLELHLSLAGEVDRLERGGVVVREVLVELVVLLLLHVLLRTLPEGDHRVEGLRLLGLLLLLALFLLLLLFGQALEVDRVGDEVGVVLDELAHAPLVEVLVELVAEVEHHARAVVVAHAVLDGVRARAVRLPLVGGVAAALLGDHAHLVGDHERGVEAHAELADELGQVGAALLLERRAERLRAGGGDRAEVLLEVVGVHARAVVGDHKRLRVLVRHDVDAPGRVVGHELLLGQAQVFRAVDGVRRVRHELAQEDLLLRVERVHHEVEHFLDLGLEQMVLLFHFYLQS